MDFLQLPVLYSFRRCPYAMRARLALHASAVPYEHREVVLKNKPAPFLALSPKGTVPVLCLPPSTPGGPPQVIEQSWDIMLWALAQNDPQAWQPVQAAHWEDTRAWVAYNDGPFKQHLDRYKYPNRFGLHSGAADRDLGATWLTTVDARLQTQAFLAGDHWGLADAALAPFVRQFAHTDPAWFAQQAWPALAQWLVAFEASPAFAHIMTKHASWSDKGVLA